jgi:hypothetical protein
MSYALQLVQERKERLARMQSRAWSPPPVEQPAEELIVPEPVIEDRPLAPSEAIELALRMAMKTAGNMQVVYGASPRPVLSIQILIRETANFFGITQGKLLAHRRTTDVILPRQIGMYLAVELTDRSLPEIGRRFGGRDHTTVLHASRKIASLVEHDQEIAEAVRLLSERITDAYDIRARGMSTPRPECRTKWTPEHETYLRDNWLKMPKREIATAIGMSSVAIYRKAWRLGLPARRSQSMKAPAERRSA